MAWYDIYRLFNYGPVVEPFSEIESPHLIHTQSVSDMLRLTDKEVINKAIDVLMAIDTDKLKAVMDAVEIDQDDWIHVKIDLRIKK